MIIVDEQMIYAIRGAATVDNSEKEERKIGEVMGMLLDRILEKNDLMIKDIISIQITQTSDLDRKNAASALREARPQFGQVPLFCAQEPTIIDMPPRMIRVMLTCRGGGKGTHVYLGDAKKLRPDFKE